MKKTISIPSIATGLVVLSLSSSIACPWANASVTTKGRYVYTYQVNENCTLVLVQRKGKTAEQFPLKYKKKSFFSKTEGWQYGRGTKITFLPDGIRMKAAGSWGSKFLKVTRNN